MKMPRPFRQDSGEPEGVSPRNYKTVEKVLLVADKHPNFVGEVGADIKKMTFIPAEAQEDAATWVPEMLGLIQKHKLHWTGFSFHPKASPVMINGWDYAPTPVWGQPAQDALSGKQFRFIRLNRAGSKEWIFEA